MKYLLDTHAAIWLFEKPDNVSEKAKTIVVGSLSDEICVSVVSVWEFAIKSSLGKLRLSIGKTDAFLDEISRNDFSLINIKRDCFRIVENLPFIHRDPFDRMLVAAAIADDMTIITADENIQKYDVKWIW